MTDKISPEVRVTKIVGSAETEAITSTEYIKAGDLNEDHVGRFMGCNDKERGVNYLAKTLKIQRFETGKAPGMSVWIRHSQVMDRLAYEDRFHVPFDSEIEIVTQVAV